MVEITSKKDIEKISFDLLKHSKALDKFPTQVNHIINYAELVINKDVDLSKIDESFISKTSKGLKNLMSNVRGFLDRREKIIYLDLAQGPTRRNFVALHEAGHNLLPWQHDIMEFMDYDATLDPETDEEFEAEANYFASITLFQHDRFDSEISKLPLSLESVTHLSKQFGASVHATFRRYVARSKKRCALLVLQNISPKGNMPLCEFRDYFSSESFENDFGIIEWLQQFGYTWPFVQDYYHKRRFKVDGEICLETKGGSVEFAYHFFNNTYNAFVFIFPKGEKIKSRTKFIVSGV
jgi:Zn-dependent peptidase ImmA (M78 family)